MIFQKQSRGRFNYVSVRPDCYDVVFKPIQGDGILQLTVTVATGLSWGEAKELMEELNEVIDDFRRGI